MKNTIKEIIRQSIDIHFHIGPEPIPRKFNVKSLINSEQDKISGLVLKNHFFPTAPFIKEIENKRGLTLFGSVTLNNSVGGLNPDVIYASKMLSDKPLVVWFPTINAENFLKKSEYEIAPEWVKNKNFKGKKATETKPVFVTKNNKINKETQNVLKAIKECNAVLSTGHLAWQETEVLIEKAKELGIDKIVITHPIYQKIEMPIRVQKQLAKKGCFIEIPYSMNSIDKIPIKRIAEQIVRLSPNSVILSSDVGQYFSPPPSVALFKYAELLKNEGFTNDELYQMLVVNPKKLLQE